MFIYFILAFLACTILVWLFIVPRLGYGSKSTRLERIKKSPQFNGKHFINAHKTPKAPDGFSPFNTLWKLLVETEGRTPDAMIKTHAFDHDRFRSTANGLSFSWLGHSTILFDVNGKTFITDPVFSRRVSFVPFLGIKSFRYTNPFSIATLPHIDYVIISHDHYDHLDFDTISKLKKTVKKFFVPLGVGAHLEGWGISPDRIVELDWWEDFSPETDIKLTLTPTRHFSGRKLIDQDRTLWGSWVVEAFSHKVYFSGDSGYDSHFKEIGKKFDSFDIAFMECGQYDKRWPYIHMNPEQTAKAASDINTKILLPIHWGKFSLSLHTWLDPISRLFKSSQGQKIITPVIGDILTINDESRSKEWWK